MPYSIFVMLPVVFRQPALDLYSSQKLSKKCKVQEHVCYLSKKEKEKEK
jgi:hypothetical protein